LPLVVGIFAIFLISFSSYLSAYTAYSNEKNKITKRAENLTNNLYQNISVRLSDLVYELSRSTAADTKVRSSLADADDLNLDSYLKKLLNSDSRISAIAIYDFIGRELASAVSPGEDFIKSDAKLISEIIQAGRALVYVKQDKNSSEYNLLFAIPILYPPTASYEGAALIRINKSIYINIIKSLILENEKVSFTFTSSPKKTYSAYDLFSIKHPKFILNSSLQIEQFKNVYININYENSVIIAKYNLLIELANTLFFFVILTISYLILSRWFNKKYVTPIRKIEKFAKNIDKNLSSSSSNELIRSIKFKDPQSILEGVLDSLSESQSHYRDRILSFSQAIESNQRRIEEITKAGNILILSVNPHTQLVDYSSSNFNIFFRDVSPKNLNWKHFFKYLDKNNKRAVIQCARNCFRHGVGKSLVIAKINNQELIFNLSLLKESINSDTRIDCIAIENTENARIQIALEQNELQKKGIVNASFDAIILLNRDALVRDCNPATEVMLSQRNFSLINQSFIHNHVAPGYYALFREYFAKLFNENFYKFSNLEIRLRNQDGTTKPVAINGALIGAENEVQACLFIRDLSEEYRQKNEILQANLEIKTILELSFDGFVSFDANGQLKNFNSPTLRMFGWTKEFLSELKTEELFNAEILKISEVISSHENIKLKNNEKLLRILKPKPKLIRCLISNPDNKKNNRPQYQRSVYFFSDITEEFQLNVLKSNFLATAAHELRTPLTTILGFSELINTQNLSEDVKQELNSSVFKNALHLKHLLDDLLDLTKLESEGSNALKLKHANPIEILVTLLERSCTKKAGAYYLKNHLIQLQISTETPCNMMIDSDKLTRTFQNILSNSEKYSHADTPISINIDHIFLDHKSFLKFDFADQGIGMTPDELSHVFNRFWRADSASGKIPGTGLGLSLCKQIIELHNGRIQLDSKYGKGTTVSIYLPLHIA